MGLKNFLDKLKQKAEDHLKEETDPAKIRAAKKEANEKKMKRTAAAIKLAQKGLATANDVNEKIEAVTDAAAIKVGELAEKAKPLAEKVDGVAGVAGEVITGAFNAAKDKAIETGLAAGAKIEEIKKDNEGKPSTGSSLLDLIAPVVPDTDATKPKPKAPEAPKPPKL
ncbi:MAG TPA: hypothetical protein VEF76_02390 [Patescibacteria group bacterium]|nr:hypothetical protein [Patescibacteria group bacterium]